MMTRARVWMYRGVAICLGLVIGEVGLAMASVVSPRLNYLVTAPWDRQVYVPDDALGYRTSPLLPGIDARGFRNETVPQRSDIVTIGDSVTYGLGAEAEDSWPRQLEVLAGKRTYNMSCSGYGPCEYLALVDEALTLRPQVIAVGLYVGNDVANAYVAAYNSNRCSQFRTPDRSVLAAVERADQAATMTAMHDELWSVGMRSPTSNGSSIPLVSKRSALYGLARGFYHSLNQESTTSDVGFDVAARRARRIVYDEDPRIRTVFMQPENLMARVDLDDPRAREGMRITTALLQSIDASLRPRGIRLVVVLLPTKHSVYRQILADRAGQFASLLRVIDLEDRLLADIEVALVRDGIEFVDTTQGLRSVLEKRIPLFHESDDTHPNAAGYRAIAEGVVPVIIGQRSLGRRSR